MNHKDPEHYEEIITPFTAKKAGELYMETYENVVIKTANIKLKEIYARAKKTASELRTSFEYLIEANDCEHGSTQLVSSFINSQLTKDGYSCKNSWVGKDINFYIDFSKQTQI
jgi:hypothetical protein